LSLPNLEEVGAFALTNDVAGGSLDTLDLPSLRTVAGYFLVDSPISTLVLPRIEAFGASSLYGRVTFELRSTRVTRLDVPFPSTTDGVVLIGNRELTDISGLATLRDAGLNFTVYACDALTDLTPIAGLETSGRFDIVYNDRLEDLSPAFGINVTGQAYIAFNDVLCQSHAEAFIDAMTGTPAVPEIVMDNADC
jgi:hypothetical protein